MQTTVRGSIFRRESAKRRILRRTLIAAVVLVAILALADAGSRVLAQYVVSRQLTTSLNLPSRPSVSLRGFPFLPHILLGRLPSATVTAKGVSAEGVTLEKVTVTLHSVRFSPSKLLLGHAGTITAGSGQGTATLTAAALNEALRVQRQSFRVQLTRGQIIISSPQLNGRFRATPSISATALRLRLVHSGRTINLSVTLPQFVSGLTYAGIRVGESIATLSFRLSNSSFHS